MIKKENGPGRAPRAGSTINGPSGTSGLVSNAQVGAQDDLSYFIANPGARTRVRAAIAGEFPSQVSRMARGRQLIVLVAIERDAAGQPTTRTRGVYFADGGNA